MLHNLESAFGIVHVDQCPWRHLLEGLFCKLLKRKFLMEVINCSWDSSWYCSWFQVKDGAVVKCVESWWMRGFCSQVSKHSLIGQCIAVMWRHLWDIFVEHLSRPWSARTFWRWFYWLGGRFSLTGRFVWVPPQNEMKCELTATYIFQPSVHSRSTLTHQVLKPRQSNESSTPGVDGCNRQGLVDSVLTTAAALSCVRGLRSAGTTRL